MFAPQYFAPRYFAPRYWHPASGASVVDPPEIVVEVDGGYKKRLDKFARDLRGEDARTREKISAAVARAFEASGAREDAAPSDRTVARRVETETGAPLEWIESAIAAHKARRRRHVAALIVLGVV